MDRHPLGPASLLELPPDAVATEPELKSVAISKPSAKVNELLKYLKIFGPDEKSLIFSQFTSFLDRVAAVLQAEGIRYCRFDGSMSGKKVCTLLRYCYASDEEC